MYNDKYSESFTDNTLVNIKNELAISNLISIVNNARVFDSLNKKTQIELVKVLEAYTMVSIDSMLSENDEFKSKNEKKLIQSYMKTK